MKRFGPELKMPKLKMPRRGSSSSKVSSFKAPPFLADVYYDLRDRRLLPLVALVVVAILAVPFLLGDSQESVEAPGLGGVESTEGQPTGGSSLTVVKSTPGLRDYRKRLKARSPSDPFVQKYTGVPPTSQLKSVESEGGGSGGGSSVDPVEAAAESVVGGSSDGGSSPSVEVPPADGGSGSGGSGGNGGGHSGGHPAKGGDDLDDDDRLYAYRPDVRFGVAGSGELRKYEDLPMASLLPKENPVLIFIGGTEDGSQVVFDVSADVAYVLGEGKCVGGRKSCELLFMRAGDAVTLQTGSGHSFRLAVDSIDFVQVDRPKSAGASAAGEPVQPGFSQNFNK